MELTVNDLTSTRKAISVSVPAEEIQTIEGSLLKDFVREAKVPGFRVGKAPIAMIRKRFAKPLRDELKQRVLDQAFQKIRTDSGLVFLSLIKLEGADDPVDTNVDLNLDFTIDVAPQFEIPAYEGIPVKTGSTEVVESEIEEAIDRIRSQQADFVVAEKPAGSGDFVKCSYEGTLEGQPVADLVAESPIYGSQKNTWEEAGNADGPGVPAIVEGLLGMAAGESKTVEHSFAEDFPVEALRGKTVSYALEVHEVREKQLPELDDAFVQGLGLESVEDLRKSITSRIQEQKEQRNGSLIRRQILDTLSSATSFDLPESSVETRRNQMLSDFMGNQMQQGATEEDFEKNKEKLYEGADAAARNRVKLDFILGKIAGKEAVTVEEDDFGRYIYNRAQQTRERPEDIVKHLKKNRAEIDEIRQNLLVDKVLLKIAEKAVKTEVSEEELGTLSAPAA